MQGNLISFPMTRFAINARDSGCAFHCHPDIPYTFQLWPLADVVNLPTAYHLKLVAVAQEK